MWIYDLSILYATGRLPVHDQDFALTNLQLQMNVVIFNWCKTKKAKEKLKKKHMDYQDPLL